MIDISQDYFSAKTILTNVRYRFFWLTLINDVFWLTLIVVIFWPTSTMIFLVDFG